MMHGDAARYRVHDLVRAAETQRRSARLAAARAAARAGIARRVVATAIALLPLPVRH